MTKPVVIRLELDPPDHQAIREAAARQGVSMRAFATAAAVRAATTTGTAPMKFDDFLQQSKTVKPTEMVVAPPGAEAGELQRHPDGSVQIVKAAAPAPDLDNIFTYHAPTGDQPQRYDAIRQKAKECAALILASCPASRERSVAMTNLETAMMWVNASIARNE